MNRRRFLQVAGLGGLAVMSPLGLGRPGKVHAGPSSYGGPFWILVNAQGGWDPTLLCDPKGGTMGDMMSVDQTYTPSQIGTAGGIQYAPVTYSVDGIEVFSGERFWSAHASRILAINGMDTQTNNHDAGTRTVWSSELAEGYPSFAALVAAVAAENLQLPMPFISNGGYDATQGLVPLARIGNNIGDVQKIAYTDVCDPTTAMSDDYFTTTTASRIVAAQQARLQAAQKAAGLPSVQTATGDLYLARNDQAGLGALAAQLAGQTLVTLSDLPDLAPIVAANQAGPLGQLQGLLQQIQIALLAFKAGAAVSVNLNIGSFDTHSNHDALHSAMMVQLLRGLDYLFTQLDASGLTPNTYVMVGSDFARTPYYNTNNGKDHWNLTSFLAAGPGITGGKAIGGTDPNQGPLTFNPTTLAPDPSGERIGTNHLHIALRNLAKISTSPAAQQYPIVGDTLPLFG
jgi:hypothetical protein